MTSLDIELYKEVLSCSLDILSECGYNLHEAQKKASRYVRYSPAPRELKKTMRRLLRIALYHLALKGEKVNG